MVPTGLISVMPQPCAASMPNSRSKAAMSGFGAAEPPMVMISRARGLRPRARISASSPSQTVGTPQAL
jgi:hypothetical protein